MAVPEVPPARYSIKTRLLARVIYWVVRLVSRTWRFQWVCGEDRFRRIVAERKPIIVCAWHNRMLGTAAFICRYWTRCGIPIGVLVSRSQDGDLGARVAQLLGGTIVRGSPNRGALGSLKALIRLIGRDRISTVIFPDGSRGPKYRAKPGPVGLARITGAALAPISWHADRQWVLARSWDGYQIPKPFATLRIAWGESIPVPRVVDEEALEANRLLLETNLHALGLCVGERFPGAPVGPAGPSCPPRPQE